MEKKSCSSSSKQKGSSSSSSAKSTIAELFGPKPSSSPHAQSSSSGASSSIFGSVFGPHSTGRGRDGQASHVRHGSKGEINKDTYYQQETVDQACYFSNSIYYGGRDDVYSPTTHNSESDQLTFKKDEQHDDPNSASRGNWWQGSLYY